ncbi:MAG: CDP-glycerol glycerophosphotransferase family protein [Chloroflexota bacterium]
MSPLGSDFLRHRRGTREFGSLDPSFRNIVFYSEGAGDWPHLGPVIEALLRDHGKQVSYLTSDPADPGLRLQHELFRAFSIGSGTARTALFARIDCRHFVMTIPDLNQLWLKRSVHPVHYVYMFHSTNSTHLAYRKGAFDAYDTILCVGPYHVDEIRKTEAAYGLPAKELVEHGSTKLDTVLAQFRDLPMVLRGDKPEILVAPSWGEGSLIEQAIGQELLRTLVDAGYKTVLRLHPMTVRRLPKLISGLRELFTGNPLLRIEEDMSATDSWLRSDLMISDWSGAATEYALALQKPVVYIDTPQKIRNPEWQAIDAPAFEDFIRREIGQIVDPSRISEIPDVVRQALTRSEQEADGIRIREMWIFNVGQSSQVAAAYLASLSIRRH